MADAPIEASIASMLNDLNSINMRHVAPDTELEALVLDYFCTRDQGVDELDSDEEEISYQVITRSSPRKPSRTADQQGETVRHGPSGSATDTESAYQEPEIFGPSDNEDDDALGVAFVEDISAAILPDLGETTDEEGEKEEKWSCKCKLIKGQPCSSQFTHKEVQYLKLNYLGLTREEKDIAILAQLSCGLHVDETARHGRAKKKRKFTKTSYFLHGHSICRVFFRHIHDISQDKLSALVHQYKSEGIVARQHKSSKKLPAHALSFQDTKRVVDFIVNFAEVHAIMLPGRQPGHWKTNIKLLPTNVTKKKVFDEYCASCIESNFRFVGKSTFNRLWQQLVPFVTTMRPATDLCWFCQKNSVLIMRSANLPDSEKSQAARNALDHLEKANAERSYYQQVCADAVASLPAGTTLGQERRSACSFNGTAHYSFDFAQQVHYPSNPLQPGPIFFKTPRKCGLFGVACEAIPCQVNFLLEECVSTGKGANCVVSLLHFFFENYGIGEEHVHLHADNCSGQNKNNCMMQYLMWRVLTGRHRSVKLSFLLTGHTKFSCDWLFGLVKRRYKVTQVDCLEDISKVVEESATCNIAQLCGTERGEVLVPMYDWTTFLGQVFRKIKGIKKYHHFHFESSSTHVVCKEYLDSEPVEFSFLPHETFDANAMPNVLKPVGLAPERQWYLFNEIRDFVADEHKDLVAPKPSCLQPKKRKCAESDDDEQEQPGPSEVKQKKTSRGRGRGRARGRGEGRGLSHEQEQPGPSEVKQKKTSRGRGKGRGLSLEQEQPGPSEVKQKKTSRGRGRGRGEGRGKK